SPDGKSVASGSDDKTIRIWDALSLKNKAKLEGHSSRVTRVAYSPDGKSIASASWDRTIRIWDASSGKETAKLEGHSSWVKCVAYSPDGKSIAAGFVDGNLCIRAACPGPPFFWDGYRGCIVLRQLSLP